MLVTSRGREQNRLMVSIITAPRERKGSRKAARSLRFAGLQRLIRRRHDDLSGLGLRALAGVHREYTLVELGLDRAGIDRISERDAVAVRPFAALARDRQRAVFERQLEIIRIDAGHVHGDRRAVIGVRDVNRRLVRRPHDFGAWRLPGHEVIEETHRIPAQEGPEASAIAVWNEVVHWVVLLFEDYG